MRPLVRAAFDRRLPRDFRLLDGPLIFRPAPPFRAREIELVLIARMAAALVVLQATQDERAAIAALLGNGFGYGEVVVHVGEALYEARQAIVTRVMAARG